MINAILTGITESDLTFYLRFVKGMKVTIRK